MWLPQHIHTHYSLLDGIIQPEKLASKLKELNYTHCTITDHGTISGCIEFFLKLKKENIKPILGSELYICEKSASIKDEENKKLKHMVVLAKNKTGWLNLINLTSKSNSHENFYYKPRLSLDDFKTHDRGSILAFTGHPGSVLGDCLYDMDLAEKKLLELVEVFGKENLVIELQLFFGGNEENVEKLRFLSKKHGIRCIASTDSHYLNKKDVDIHRIILCSNLKLKLKEVKNKLLNNEEVPLSSFFTKECFYLHTEEELKAFGHTEEEINCEDIIAQFEEFKIEHPPLLPDFSKEDQNEILLDICRQGWKKKYKSTWNTTLYVNRVKKELAIIKDNNLAGYFLIVLDYINKAKEDGYLVGPGRGSVCGSLVAYLSGITNVDPLEYDLLFERFFNPGRSFPKHISFKEYKYIDDYRNNKYD